MNPPLRKPPRGTRIMNPLYRKTPTVETIEESSSSENDDFSETGGKVSNRRLLVRFPQKITFHTLEVCPLDKKFAYRLTLICRLFCSFSFFF